MKKERENLRNKGAPQHATCPQRGRTVLGSEHLSLEGEDFDLDWPASCHTYALPPSYRELSVATHNGSQTNIWWITSGLPSFAPFKCEMPADEHVFISE